MSELLALGTSHKTAPLPLREKLALLEGGAEALIRELTGHEHISEAVAISTCNRTELYLVVSDPVDAESHVLGLLARRAAIRPTEMAVSVRTRLPVASAARNSLLDIGPVVRAASAISYARLTWPWTSASPTIMESSPPATANRCATASLPRRE